MAWNQCGILIRERGNAFEKLYFLIHYLPACVLSLIRLLPCGWTRSVKSKYGYAAMTEHGPPLLKSSSGLIGESMRLMFIDSRFRGNDRKRSWDAD